jgi:LPXTG-motif cell wall-anchored protein
LNLLKSRFRRTTAIVAGAFIGLTGAFAFVSPALATHPTVNGSSDCVSDKGWTVDWTLTNEWPYDGTITKVEVLEPENRVLTGDIKVDAAVQQGADFKLTGKQQLSPDATEAKIKVTVRFTNEHEGDQVGLVKRPEKKCETPPPTPGKPTPLLEEDCTTISIGLDNPADGREVTLKFETSKGEVRTTVVKPGEKKFEKFSAVPGFTVKVTPTGIDGAGPETIEYKKPADCDTAGNGGGLPVTGAAAGTIAGGAGLLLAIGAVLFVVSRRRKVKFTA